METKIMDENDKENEEDFIKPHLETKLSKEKKDTCRMIVKEIRNYPVSQRQMLYIIQLLALELENRDAMQRIVNAVHEHREELDNHQPKILTAKDELF